jgi:hypothetical protein
MDARPGGPAAKRQPSPEGLGINSEDDLSAVGAALNLGPLAHVSLGMLDGPVVPGRSYFRSTSIRLATTTLA